jgi:hypothetical protein
MMRRELEKKRRGRLRADIALDVTAAVQLTSVDRGLQIQWLDNPDLPVSEYFDAFLNLLRVD